LINGVFPLSKLTINNTTNVTLNNNLTVTKLLKLLNGVLNSNGKLTIDLNTGNIDPSGVGSIAGNITVSKFVNSFKTHYFACPLDGVTCLDLIDDAEVINPSTLLTRLFQLDYSTNKWVAIKDMSSPLIKGVPYSLYFTTPTTLDFTGTYDHAYIQSFSVDNSTSKLYFIPNPYPCSLDWDSPSGWTNKSALNNSISFWDGATSKYITYTTGAGINGATNIIPSMQGYWIRTNGAGGTFPIVIGKGAWKPDETKALWRTVALNDNYSIKIRNTKTNVSDETILRFMNEATVDFDVQYDAIKFLNPSSNPNLYSNKDKTNYAIQSLPLPNIDTIIPLNIKVPTIGDYEISVMNNVFNPNIEVFLYDSVTTQYMPLNQMTTLGFNSTQSTQRIGLVFKISNNNVTTSTNTYNNTNEDYYVYSEYGSSFLVTKKKSTQLMDFTLYTFDGKMVRNYSNVLLNENIPFNLMLEQVNSGVYLLKNNKDNMSLKFIKY
jgi:hypothetical protein